MAGKPKTNRKPGMDVCQTPPYALDCIIPLLPRSFSIWESACGPEQLIEKTLRKAGYEVFGTDLSGGVDFFNITKLPAEVQVTNPPFSQKYEWIEHSFELGRFALLVPYETTFAAKFQKVCEKYNKTRDVIVHSPRQRIDFKMPIAGWSGNGAQMPTCWITWGLDTPQAKPAFSTYYADMNKISMKGK